MSGTARTVQNIWGSTAVRSTVVGLGVFGALLTTSLVVPAGAQADDSSEVTLTTAALDPDAESAPFPELSVTISQAKNLSSQGIRLTYSGGSKSAPLSLGASAIGPDFLQVFQCWGDLVNSVGRPVLDANGQRQPDRTTCQYGSGASLGFFGQSRTSAGVDAEDLAPQDDSSDTYAPGDHYVSIPFRSVTGKVLQGVEGGKTVADIDNNQFFTKLTTNELDWAPFGASGSGTSTFEVQTNMQAPGLGCGNPVTATDGSVTGQPCWLVVVPRGDHEADGGNVRNSALLWDNWKHRLAVPLQFKPLGVRCALGAAESALAGTEMMAAAVGSWQPKLCGAAGGSIYNLIISDEADQLVQATRAQTAPLALTTRALGSPGTTGLLGADLTDNLTYAPVAVTGLTVAFAIDHTSNNTDPDVPDSVTGLDAQPITTLNLTPRLVAKLLTNSYPSSLPRGANAKHLGSNPQDLVSDPDFLAVNDPIWKDQLIHGPGALADALVPLGRSDAAVAVWNYVLSDPDAVAFLAGKPDPWGMVVNPYSATDPAKNPTTVGSVYPTDSFPKADPVEIDPLKGRYGGLSLMNLVTWRPYANDLDTAAYWVLRGDGRVPGDFQDQVTPPKYAASTRDIPGAQKVIGLTDTASAAKYQVFTASLRNPAGAFVAPTSAGMSAAAEVMTPTEAQPQVRALDFAAPVVKKAADAYPLTVPVYAATASTGGDASTRAAYAAFIRYAASTGQNPGTEPGDLPPGYAPMPAAWRTTANAAATVIANDAAPAPADTDTDTDTTTTDQTAPATGGGTAPEAPPSQSDDPDAAVPAPPAAAPVATGEPAGALLGASTPDDAEQSPVASTVPASVVAGLAAAACVPLIRRKKLGAP